MKVPCRCPQCKAQFRVLRQELGRSARCRRCGTSFRLEAPRDGGAGEPEGQSGSEGPDATSLSLLGRVQSGRSDAWGQLVDLYGPLIYGWCRRSGLQGEDAADVMQEVFSAVSSRVDQFRRERPGDSFRGWLWTITRNKIRDHFRRLSKHAQAPGGTDAQLRLAQIPERPPELSDGTGEPSAEKTGLESRALELVRAGVEERTWRAFWRVAIDEQAVADVADELGMSVRAVYEAKYRVRRRIRQELEGLIE